MALPLKKTLGEIRSNIQTRLGFGMAGQAGIVNSALIDSMIQSAQEQLYLQFDWAELKAVYERSTGSDQQFYDYPVDCNIERMTSFVIIWGGRHIPLKEGIEPQHRTLNAGSVPARYERRDQIELYPIPQTDEYTLRFEYIKTLSPLIVNSDRTSLPSEIIYLHALSNAKAHYRQPDAETYASQLDALMNKLKAKHRSTKVYGRERKASPYDNVTSDQDV